MANIVIDNRSKLDTVLMERTIREIISAYEAVYPSTDEKVTFVLLGSQEEYLAYLYDTLDGVHHIEMSTDCESMFVMPSKAGNDLTIAVLAKEKYLQCIEGYFMEKDQGSRKDKEKDIVKRELRVVSMMRFFQLAELMLYEYSRLNSFVEMKNQRSSDYRDWWGLEYILHDTLLSNYRGITALLKMMEPYLRVKEQRSFCRFVARMYSCDMNRGHERNKERIDKLLDEMEDYPDEDAAPDLDLSSYCQMISNISENDSFNGTYYSGDQEDDSFDDFEYEPDRKPEFESYYDYYADSDFTFDDYEALVEFYPDYMDVLYTLLEPAAFFDGAQYYGFAQGVYDYLKERTGFLEDTWRMPKENLSIVNVINIPFYEYLDASKECSVVNTMKMITMIKHIGTDFEMLEKGEEQSQK